MRSCHSEQVRVGVVLSAGGLRGAVHVGVLRQLVRHGIPIDVLVGVSAGAVVAAYYAAVGLDFDELLADAFAFRGRHLLMHSLNVRLHYRFDRWLAPVSGVIPDRLRQLEAASFDRLEHGVRSLGIVCHDLMTGHPCYFSSGVDQGASLNDVVRASASIPLLFPPVPVICGGRRYLLTDGGISDPLPLAFARRTPLGATHLIVSDTRWLGRAPLPADDVVWIRPRLARTGTLWAPSQGLLPAVQQGEFAVSDEILARIRRWWSPSKVEPRAHASHDRPHERAPQPVRDAPVAAGPLRR